MADEPKQLPTPSDILQAAKELCEATRHSPRDAIGFVARDLYHDFWHDAGISYSGVHRDARSAEVDEATEIARGFWQRAFLEIFDKAIALAEKREEE